MSLVTLVLSNPRVEVFDFVEISLHREAASADNPFQLDNFAEFALADGLQTWRVEGFCDADDGRVFRFRFMPPKRGKYGFHVFFGREFDQHGEFEAVPSPRAGLMRVDREHPFHFVQERGDVAPRHWFWNGTTTYWLAGWNDEGFIKESIERLARMPAVHVRAGRGGTPDYGRAQIWRKVGTPHHRRPEE
ncbi:MAG: DUF5060 domain-containing protein [Verrucomicrobiales bacterium]